MSIRVLVCLLTCIAIAQLACSGPQTGNRDSDVGLAESSTTPPVPNPTANPPEDPLESPPTEDNPPPSSESPADVADPSDEPTDVDPEATEPSPEDPGVSRCENEDLQPLDAKPSLSTWAYLSLVQQGLFVKEAELMTVSYHEGYNLNFEITAAEARTLLPCNLSPVPIRIIESDPEPRYYLSLYMAVLGAGQLGIETSRIDLFTYGQTSTGELSLAFVSSYMGLPEQIKGNDFMFGMFEEIFDFFARDSRTGEPAYPHYYADLLTVSHDTFKLVHGQSRIEATACEPVTRNERFTLDFINANSQIYRSPIDKNVNYFNQSFIKANVETRDVTCVRYENLTGFHPLLRDLKSIQFYGTPDKKITWYYQMCTGEVCGNPLR